MDNKSTTKRMIGAVVLVLIAALLLAWLLKGKNRPAEQKDLIAEQTQESTPILGFPGVKEDPAQNGDASLAAANSASDPATQQAGANPNQEYAIGSTGAGGTTPAATDPAQQQAQNVLGTQDPNAAVPIADPNTSAQAGSATGSAAATGTGVVAAAGSAVAGAVESGKQAIQGMTSQMQPDTTGFQVRDPKQGEVREVVENGQKQPGVGNMGANATTSSPDNTKAAATSDADSAASTSKTATAASPTGSGNETAKTVSANKSSSTGGNASAKDSPVVNSGELKPENPRLVNERPVPAPSAQPRNTASTRPATTTTSTTTTVERRVPTKPTEKPVVTTADASASGYVIQVLATSDKAKADSIRTSMTSEGYPVFVTNAKVDGKTVYRVRVGTYPGKGDAAAVQARMKARYTQNQYVQNSFVTKN